MSEHILLVDDEPALVAVLKPVLRAAGYVVSTAVTGLEAIVSAESGQPDVILLDLGLPDIDGLEVIRKIRSFSITPIIVVSARHQILEKTEALDSGADDYVDKPFDIEEILARTRAAARRGLMTHKAPTAYEIGPLRVTISTRSVALYGENVHLSPKEFDLLIVLIRSSGQVVTQKRLLIAGWGSDKTDPQYLRVYIGLLRQKVEENASDPRMILTVPGVGYRLVGHV